MSALIVSGPPVTVNIYVLVKLGSRAVIFANFLIIIFAINFHIYA